MNHCHYTVVGVELSFRPTTPGNQIDGHALPPVRPCPHPPVAHLPCGASLPPVAVCAGHEEAALQMRAAQNAIGEARWRRRPQPKTSPACAPRRAG